jgi:hypothetical protein
MPVDLYEVMHVEGGFLPLNRLVYNSTKKNRQL